MKVFLDLTASFVLLVLAYAVALRFVSLPDIRTTFSGLPGGLVAFPIFYLWFVSLRHQFQRRRRYWLVFTFLVWPLSAFYYLLISRKEPADGAQPAVAADVVASASLRQRRG